MQLHNVQDEAAETDAEHEVEEDGLLRCSWHKAVSSVWTGVGLTAEKVRDLKSKQVVLPNEEDYLHDGPQQNMYDVDKQHLAGELSWVLSYLSHFLIQLAPILTLIFLGAPLLIVTGLVIRTASFQRGLFISSGVSVPVKRSGGLGHHDDLLNL